MNLPIVQNYHKHSDDTNIIVVDSPTSYEDYIKRIKELGASILSSVAHGWQGRYHMCYELAKKHNLKFIFGSEVYWVKDRTQKDNTNAHMIILAKNKEGMKEINYMLSIANTDGYYFKPRVDLELLFNLNPNNVFITTACIGGWKYSDSEEIFLKLYKHFKNNFMLEIQMHNTKEQKEINKKIIDMSNKYGIDIILGIDSHYIYPEQKEERDYLLSSKNFKYHENEIDWFMDYPDSETIFNRLKEQGILNEKEIIRAMENTNITLDFDNIEFNKKMKLPTIYPDLSQEEKNTIFKGIINDEFKNFISKNKIPKNKIKDYKKAILDEAEIILNTNMADYFLLNYEIIKKGKENGGVMTPSGRGCFTKNALILTNTELKTINTINVGDKVLTIDGSFQQVINKMEYNINEPTIEIIPQFSKENDVYKNVCTLDHKIYIKRDNALEWIQAKDILLTDKLCIPKIKKDKNKSQNTLIDLSNFSNFDYDDNFIYETKESYACKKISKFINDDYLFSFVLGTICNCAVWEDNKITFTDNIYNSKRHIKNLKTFLNKYNLNYKKDELQIISPSFIKFLETEVFNDEKHLKIEITNTNSFLQGLLIYNINDNKVGTYSKYLANLIKEIGLKENKYFSFSFVKIPYKKHYYKNKFRKKIIIEQKNVENDKNYFYLSIDKIKLIEKKETIVYDLEIENNHNYTIHNMLVHNSSGGFLLNTLFGFSSMDRLNAPIELYPERFLTEERVKAGSLVDIDFNVSNAEPFIEAQKEIMGENHSYPMIAFGTIKAKSGFKMYARAKNLNFEIANEISKQIDQYEKDAIYEDSDTLSIYDYIDKEYHSYIDNSKSYLGLIIDKKIAPCSHILYTEEDLRKEIGVMRLVNKVTKKDVLVACIEGYIADKFGYLKNDILTVSVLDIISTTYKKIGRDIDTVTELTSLTKDDNKVWDIYAKGYTCCINQCESSSTTEKVMKYKPKNITELSGFIASIRPGFKSMYSLFEKRVSFEYGIKSFDNLIQTKEMPYSFILYQEQLMKTFSFVGYPISECYTIIKAVAKKKPEVLLTLKKEFKEKCMNKLIELENIEKTKAETYANKIWQIAEDSSRYSFNASHSLAYAYDSLYCAYLKAYYPFEFYETILEFYSNKGEKDRVKGIIQEMKHFNILLGDFKYLSDNRKFVANKEKRIINRSLTSIKGISKDTPNELYMLPKLDNFIDLLVYINENTKIKKNEIKKLIYINYFDTFGSSKKLLEGYELFYNTIKYNKNNTEKTKNTKINKIKDEFYLIPNNIKFSKLDCLIKELEILGESNITFDNSIDDYIVIDIDKKYSPYKVEIMNLENNETLNLKVYKNVFDNLPFFQFSILTKVEIKNNSIKNYKILEKELHFK